MRFIPDTHTLLWWWGEPGRLSERALSILADGTNEVLASSVSSLEIGIKTRIGKLPGGERIVETWFDRIEQDCFIELPISARHALHAGMNAHPHRDPFDRLLAAQSIIEGVPILGCDPMIAELGACSIW